MNANSLSSKWVRFTWHLVRLEKTMAVALLIVVVVALAAQVVARYVFGAPISWSEEVARLALIWLTFVASGFVTADRAHIVVDLVPRRLGTRAMGMLDQLTGGLVLATCLLLLVGGFQFVWRVWPVESPGIGVSMSLWYGAASFGLALMSFHTAVQLFAKPDQRLAEHDRGEGARPDGDLPSRLLGDPVPENREAEGRP